MKRVRLFCLPFAGGTALAYQAWRRELPPWIDLAPVELAGRGARVSEPFYGSFAEAVADVAAAIRPQLGETPFALFGHSMGSWLAYELYHQLVAEGAPAPVHLFLSARRAPHTAHAGPILHMLSDEELVDELLRLGGTPAEVFANPALRELFLKVIRADLQITETYRYVERERKIESPVTVLNGKADHTIQVRELFAWRSLTAAPCSICNLDGDHFFVTRAPDAVARVITQALERTL